MNRKGLTLVEMLVALALTIFMMAILSEAFVTGLNAFRRLKAVGDMDEQLRTAAIVLRRDLAAEHFDGYRRLRDYQLGTVLADGSYDRPQQGYFCVREGATTGGLTSTIEGQDGVNRTCAFDHPDAANGDPGDALAFTVRLPGNRPEKFFYGAVPLRARNAAATPPPPQPLDTIGLGASRFDTPVLPDRRYASQWAEVVYHLVRDGTRVTYDKTTGFSLPIYRLYRTQLLLVPEVFTMSVSAGAYEAPEAYAAYSNGGTTTVIDDMTKWQNYFAGQVGTPNQYTHDVSAWAEPQSGGTWRYRYNSPADVQFRERRYGEFGGGYVQLGAVSAIREGADLLAVNIISWDVKVYDLFAIKGTAINVATQPQVKYLPEFVDLGHNGTQALPLPATDGVYNYAWNDYWTDPNNPPPNYWRNPQFRNNGNNANLARTFDTWTNRNNGLWNYTMPTGVNYRGDVPYPGPLTAIQITLRIWDEKTEQTRQITIVQDM